MNIKIFVCFVFDTRYTGANNGTNKRKYVLQVIFDAAVL